MFATAFATAIAAAHPAQFDQLSRTLWQSHGAGSLTDGEAQSLAETLQGLRPPRASAAPGGVTWLTKPRPSIYPPRHAPLVRQHPERIDRRRSLASSGTVPSTIAKEWTLGEQAVLTIVANETHRGTKPCDRTLGEIAARAGVCRSLAQATLRRAQAAGLVIIEERPRPGQKNLPNLVRIISAEWRGWLRRKPRIGSREKGRTDTNLYQRAEISPKPNHRNGSGSDQRRAEPPPPDL